MNEALPNKGESVPLSLQRRVDQICLRFERAWKAKQRPTVEEFLGDTPEPERSVLRRELIALETAYRQRSSENSQTENDRGRFLHERQRGDLAIHEAATLAPPHAGVLPVGRAARQDGLRKATEQAPADVASPLPIEEVAAADQTMPPGYDLLGVLGRGGMGVVYKARQRALDRVVAVKMILAGAHAGPEELGRFRREAATIARLHHPHIVHIYEVGEQNGQPFCALEFVEGGSLARNLNGTPQPPRLAAQLVETLARAIHAAHQAGIIHRDLKPANVLLTVDGTPKITDFGLAKQLHEEAWKTRSGVIVGTPSYMAPEQASGRRDDIGPHTDVYSLGTVLYEMLTGRAPFLAATQLETLDQVRLQEPVPPSRVQPKVPRDLETICLKCIEKDPRHRYPSAEALAEDLHRFLANEPIQARPVRLWERGLKWARRKPAIAALIAVSAVALLSTVAGGLLYLDQRARQWQQDKEQWALQLQREKRAEIDRLVRDGDIAAGKGDWDNARVYLASALAKIEPGELFLSDLREQATALQQECEQKSRQRKERRDAEVKYQEFRKEYDQALFHETLATGADRLVNLRATRDAAETALALFDVAIDASGRPSLDRSFTPIEKAKIIESYYELLLTLAEAEALQDRFPQALRILDRAATLGWPGHPTQAYHLRRARYLEQLHLPGAPEERMQATKCPPTTALDFYLIGDEYYKQGRAPEAIRAFESAVVLQPDHFWARYFLSVSYLMSERQHPGLAKTHLTNCINQRPDFMWLYLLRGFAHTKLKAFQDAEKDFDEALKLSKSKDALHVLHANRGLFRLEQRRFKEAVEDLKRAIELKPDKYQAYVSLARVYQEQKQWDEAVKQLDAAIQLEPKLPFIYRLRALLYLERPDRNLEAALRDTRTAVEEEERAGNPANLAGDYAEMGRILFLSQKYDDAVAVCNRAVVKDPGQVNAYLWRAQALLKLQKYDQAAHSFDQYLAKGGKKGADVYRGRGLARARLNHHEDAIQDYTQALAMEPDNGFTRAARGWAYLAREAYQLALSDFDKAIELKPETGDPYRGRAHARLHVGQYRQAVRDAEEALRRGPKSPLLLYDTARIYAQAVGKLRADPRPPNRPALVRDYQDRAVGLIRESLGLLPAKERGPFWRDNVHPDGALSPIRDSTGFLQLAAEYLQWAK
jgi:eukaryotic-like serine/threonine-protein kinase